MKRKRGRICVGRFVALRTSVRLRLTLWYLGVFVFILISFSASVYAAQREWNESAIDAQLEQPLYADVRKVSGEYREALKRGETVAGVDMPLEEREVVLLLSPDGRVLDQRGGIREEEVERMKGESGSVQPTVSMWLFEQEPRRKWGRWEWHTVETGDYRVAIAPVMDGDKRLAVLMVGLPRESKIVGLHFWFGHVFGAVLVGLIGGYWIAGKALKPVERITKLANEINATDLRRRLNIQRGDEFGRLAATFDQMLGRLEAAFKRQTQFTADASHELRTPLTIVNLEINRALTQMETVEEYRQVLEQLQAENQQMTEIVNSLLLLARADTGQIVVQREIVDMSDIALGSVERLLPLARAKKVGLVVGELPELLVRGDEQYLQRMIVNLVENGIKYTSGVGSKVTVELGSEGDKWAVLRVRDDGPGIGEEHIPYVFERFYRVDKARSFGRGDEKGDDKEREEPGGNGLGLSIVQWIVQAHGGEVRVESERGVGSLFEVRLPLGGGGVSGGVGGGHREA